MKIQKNFIDNGNNVAQDDAEEILWILFICHHF